MTLPGHQVVVVVALVQDYALRFDGEDAGCHLVEEGPVVGGEQDAAAKAAQVILKPQVGFQVQVVGGLVKEEQVGLAEENPGQAGPHYPAAAELAQGTVKVGRFETETGEDGLGLIVPVFPAGGFQVRVQPCQALQ